MITFLSLIGVAVLLLCACLPLWHVQAQSQARAKAVQARRDDERRRMAVQLSPSYQQAQAQAHAHSLALEKMQLDREKIQIDREKIQIEWAKVQHQQWLAMNIIQPDSYRIVDPDQEAAVRWFPGGKMINSPVAAQSIEPEPLPALLPTAPRFNQMRHLIGPDCFPLGYSVDGTVEGDIDDLLSMLLCGRPGSGKSTGLMYYLAVLLTIQASVYVIDPQGSLNEVRGLIPYAGRMRDIYPMVATIREEIEMREEQYQRGRREFKPMLLLVDELPLISQYEEQYKVEFGLVDLTGKIVRENRKHRCFTLLSGQSIPASVLPTITRDNMSSRVVFQSSAAHARMAGLSPDAIRLLLPQLDASNAGTAILDINKTKRKPTLCKIPFTTIEDVSRIIDETRPRPDAQRLDVLDADFFEENDDFLDVQTSGKIHLVPPGHTTEPTSGERPETPTYQTLSDVEIDQFIVAYRAAGSIDKALGAIKKGTSYRQHAREIVRIHRLKQEA